MSPWIWMLKVGSLPKDWVLGVGGEQVVGDEAGRHGGRSPHRKISCMKQVASPGSMHNTGCLGLTFK